MTEGTNVAEVESKLAELRPGDQQKTEEKKEEAERGKGSV